MDDFLRYLEINSLFYKIYKHGSAGQTGTNGAPAHTRVAATACAPESRATSRRPHEAAALTHQEARLSPHPLDAVA